MPVKKGRYSGDSKTSIMVAVIIGLFLIVGACAMIFGVHDDLYDDTIETTVKFGKIAVAADGKKLNSYVSPLFGRARYFLIVDPNTGEYKAIRNPFRNLDGAAGVRAAQLIAKEVDDGVITGDIGPNAYNVLNGLGMNVYTGFTGESGKAVENYKSNKIAAAKSYTVPQFYGRSQIASVMDYFHCPNCNTVVPCPYNHTGTGGYCPSCGLRMKIISNNMAETQGITGSNIYTVGGFGRGGGLGLGPGGYLECPNCGTVVPHQRGVPAYSVNCPNCGTVMYRQLPAYLPTAFNNPIGIQNVQSTQSGTQTTASPITSNAVMTHEYRGVCSSCHQIVDIGSQSGSYSVGVNSYNGTTRPYRIGPGGCIIR